MRFIDTVMFEASEIEAFEKVRFCPLIWFLDIPQKPQRTALNICTAGISHTSNEIEKELTVWRSVHKYLEQRTKNLDSLIESSTPPKISPASYSHPPIPSNTLPSEEEKELEDVQKAMDYVQALIEILSECHMKFARRSE